MDTVTVRPPLGALALVVIVGGLFYVGGKYIETRDREIPMISVSGEGKTSVTPDIVRLSLGVQTGQMKTASAAMQTLKTSMDKVLAAVRAQGIDNKDINTQQFYLSPVYDWSTGRQIILGYQATQSLEVKVRELDKASDVLGAATSAGANQAGDVQFTVDDPEKARAEARAKAIVQAQQKAEQLAKDLGGRLGKIKNFSEGYNGGYPVPTMSRSYDMAAEGAEKQAVELPAGDQEVNVSVSITYELR